VVKAQILSSSALAAMNEVPEINMIVELLEDDELSLTSRETVV